MLQVCVYLKHAAHTAPDMPQVPRLTDEPTVLLRKQRDYFLFFLCRGEDPELPCPARLEDAWSVQTSPLKRQHAVPRGGRTS